MTKQKAYPINPIFETTTRDGRKAWVAFWEPDNHCYPWRGAIADTGEECWTSSGRYTISSSEGESDLKSTPEIPPEAREPKPGEVWETKQGYLVLIERTTEPGLVVWRSDGRHQLLSRHLTKPSDRPHGFEALIEAILQSHGNKE